MNLYTICTVVFLSLSLSHFLAYGGVSGTIKWVYETSSFNNISSTPAIGFDGTIYFGSRDSKVYALNPDGSLKWEFDTGLYGVSSSPAIGVDGTIYIGSDNHKLHAINPDGTEKWAFKTFISGIGASPALSSDGTIYIGGGDYFYAINPDGSEKWSVRIPFTCTDTTIGSSASIAPDGTIYVGSCGEAEEKLYALNPDGTEKWTYPVGENIQSSPTIGEDGTIYFGAVDAKVHAVNPDGSRKWVFGTSHYVYASPAIGADGVIYISDINYLIAISPYGTLKWTVPRPWQISSVAIGSDDTIYASGSGGRLSAFDVAGNEKWDLNPPDPVAGLIISSPVLGTDGTVYVGLGNNLYAIYCDSEGAADSPWPVFRQNMFHTGTQGAYPYLNGPVEYLDITDINSPQTVENPFTVQITSKNESAEKVQSYNGSFLLKGFSGSMDYYFNEDFEDGNFAGWDGASTLYSRQVTDTTAAQGNYSLTMTGGFVNYSSLKGLNYNFPAPQSPQEISFHVRSGSTTLNDGYFVIGTGSSRWEIPIWFYMSENGSIYANGDTTFSYDANTWYKIRFDIDWDGQTFDLYVDDQPVSMGIALRDSQTSFSTVYLINPDGSQSWWDAIQFDSSLRSPVTLNPSEEQIFSSGNWSGSVMVAEPVSDLYLVADDGHGNVGISNQFTVLPQGADSDGDGLLDSIENSTCTDPDDADSDDDGLSDGTEDHNLNGVKDDDETHPCELDTDGDGLQDGTELGLDSAAILPGTDLTVFRPDLDKSTTTNPLSNDSDGDTILDGIEDANLNGRWDLTETAADVASGDYDLSKVVDLRDLLPVLQIVAGDTPGGAIEVSADTNGDHVIGLADGIYIIRFLSD